MKQLIGILRLVGLATFISFIVSILLKYTQVANISIIVSISCFAVIILLQLYYFYIRNYLKKEKADIN
jgi:hypothetical protein